jgi:hypothetical protein
MSVKFAFLDPDPKQNVNLDTGQMKVFGNDKKHVSKSSKKWPVNLYRRKIHS